MKRLSAAPWPPEAQKTLARKRQELARVTDSLRSPDLSPGMARELRKHVAVLEREIAELEHHDAPARLHFRLTSFVLKIERRV
jgi:hypothetical protein